MPLFLQLPQEIVDRFVDYLQENGRCHQLQACTLTHRSFLPRCHFYLFSIIHLRDAKTSRMSDLCNILQRNPFLGQFIQEMRLSVSGTDLSCFTNDRWFIMVVNLLTQQGCSLRKLAIIKANASWPARIIHPDVFAKQMSCIVSSAQEFEFGSISGVPMGLVTPSAELRKLVLNDATFAYSETEPTEVLQIGDSPSPLAGPSIRHLEISSCPVNTLYQLLFPDDYPRKAPIQTLDMRQLSSITILITSRKNMAMAHKVLGVIGKQLHSLRVTLDYIGDISQYKSSTWFD
ncbi:hypothetical protein H0H81_010592 [Sphagnurus paluster]|uniref:Uncharacterized protein n=1 Tax=Sphagnurus paluster TaxID=117069 RepID=A0A9P7GHX6_9AGAR|nr:hypothetical protein H0H81_010592 [Sphagnurus paluster]